ARPLDCCCQLRIKASISGRPWASCGSVFANLRRNHHILKLMAKNANRASPRKIRKAVAPTTKNTALKTTAPIRNKMREKKFWTFDVLITTSSIYRLEGTVTNNAHCCVYSWGLCRLLQVHL